MQIVAKTNDCIKKLPAQNAYYGRDPNIRSWTEILVNYIRSYQWRDYKVCKERVRRLSFVTIHQITKYSTSTVTQYSLYTPSQAASFVRYIPAECRRAVCCRALWVGLQISATASKFTQTQTHLHLVTNIHNSSVILAQLTGTVSLSSCKALSAGQSPREIYSRSTPSTNGVCESC